MSGTIEQRFIGHHRRCRVLRSRLIVWASLALALATLPARSATFQMLHTFTGGTDGAHPFAGLMQASNGLFYGVTSIGGTNNNGKFFRLASTGGFTNLSSLPPSHGNPLASLKEGQDGNF